jgi:hypothetical protein
MIHQPTQSSSSAGKTAFIAVLISFGIAGYHLWADVYYKDMISTRMIKLENRIEELRHCLHAREKLSDILNEEIERFRGSNNWQDVVSAKETLQRGKQCSEKVDGVQDALDQLDRIISPPDKGTE